MRKLSCTPSLPEAPEISADLVDPNIADIQDGKYTATGSPLGAGRLRDRPPPGNSLECSGIVSFPNNARIARLAGCTNTAGSFSAAVRLIPAALVAVSQ